MTDELPVLKADIAAPVEAVEKDAVATEAHVESKLAEIKAWIVKEFDALKAKL